MGSIPALELAGDVYMRHLLEPIVHFGVAVTMLYTIQRLPHESIFIVRLRPPLHSNKDIYAIDTEIDRMVCTLPGPIYRIDDLSLLGKMDFTLSDAVMWLTGVLRDEQYWEGPIVHTAVGNSHILKLTRRINDEGIDRIRVKLHPTLLDAVDQARLHIRRFRDE